MNPKVSVCMPVFNGSQYLRAGVESALPQTLSYIELVVVDDGLTDSSVSIAREYASQNPFRVVAVEGYPSQRGTDASVRVSQISTVLLTGDKPSNKEAE